ncbi:hypothetical protein FRC15_004534 [Serendipita sp. 397]|nr:hypothetical protein FRC15_004534 [Serendipita sp. 397]
MSQTARLRVFALPLTRPSRPAKSSGVGAVAGGGKKEGVAGQDVRPAYVYYHVQSPPEPSSNTKNPNAFKKMMDKALDTWTSFGKEDKASWKYKLYNWGEKVADRVEFEETALKHVNVSFKPTENNTEPLLDAVKGQFISPRGMTDSLDVWRKHVEHREPYHKRYMLLWSLGLPITAPIGIAPIIPNVPFYFCAWRAWSHWRAWRGTKYLNQLLAASYFESSTNTTLDQIYDRSFIATSDTLSGKDFSSTTSTTTNNANHSTPDATSSPSPPSSSSSSTTSITSASIEEDEQLLLREADVPVLIEALQLQPSVGPEILRAIEQARLRLRKELKASQQQQQQQQSQSQEQKTSSPSSDDVQAQQRQKKDN